MLIHKHFPSMSSFIVKNYQSYFNVDTKRIEFRKYTGKIRSHDQIIYEIEQPPTSYIYDNEYDLRNFISNQTYGAYLVEYKRTLYDNFTYNILQALIYTPLKISGSKSKSNQNKTFNICSVYPRFNNLNPGESIVGKLIGKKNLKADRAMVSKPNGPDHTNFNGHKDIKAKYAWPENPGNMKLIYFDKTFGIQSDEFCNKYYGSDLMRDYITKHRLDKLYDYHNHEFVGSGAIIAVKGIFVFINSKILL